MVGQGSYSSGSPIVKEVEHNCPPLPCGLCIGTFFQRAQYGKGGSVTFTLQSRNLARTTSAGVIKVNIMLTACTVDMM